VKFKICKKKLEIKNLPIVVHGGLVIAKLQEEKDKIIKIFKRHKSSKGSVVWCVTYHKIINKLRKILLNNVKLYIDG
jgi:hypothetical protein